MKLTLSTSNIMNGGPSVIRKPYNQKSNIELINSLRSNFEVSQISRTTGNSPGSSTNSNVTATRSSYKTWTSTEDDTLYIPSHQPTPLTEPRESYDITCKLFYLPNIPASRRCAHTREAISLVLKELAVSSIDLLIVSFPGVSFDADDDGEEEVSSEDSERNEVADPMETMVTTWKTIEKLHEDGVIAQLGVAEFSSDRLAKFLPETKIKPSVDQINVKDCCVVPKSLILYAKQEGIQLLTHNDTTDILPQGTTRELLGSGKQGAGILANGDAENGESVKGDVEPQWVIKYTAVVKDRGVIENKGYFAVAQVGECIQAR